MDATTMHSSQAVPVPEFKDRRVGLIVFGVLEILAGAICLLLVPLMILGQTLSAKMGQGEISFRFILPAVLLYVILAGILIWLGIGSVLVRRWGRALSLILGWSWLAIGVVAMIAYAIVFPQIFSGTSAGGQPMPEAVKTVALVVSTVILGFIYILVPGAMVLFYGSRHAKATCEARDPVVRWTDTCPLPLLGVCLWLWFGAAMMLLMPAFNSVVAFFGKLLSGWAGALVYVLLAAIWAYAARALYQRKVIGWWLVVIAMAVFLVSNLITFARVEVTEMYRLMGYPEAQIAHLQQYSFLKGKGMIYLSVACVLPMFGYLIYVRRFLSKPVNPPPNVGAE
jgi:energy-converting hydrogenase Eha subunit E